MPARKPREEMPKEVREQVDLLENALPLVRQRAAEALGEIKHKSAVPHLIQALKDPVWQVRGHAAEALGKIGHVSAVPNLAKALQGEKEHFEVRWRAATALGKIGHESAVPHLVKALQDEYSPVREEAVEALGRIGHESAVPSLVKALKDPYLSARLKAVWALGVTGRSIQGKKVKSKEAKALQLVGAYFREKETPKTILKSFHAALEGKVTKENARLYVKQLRALEGSVK